MSERFIGIQVGAISFLDEGVNKVLDTFQEKASVNALLLASPTWTRGTGGRQIPGHPIPDHGVQEYDLNFHGGNYARVHQQYYAKTIIGEDVRAPDHGDWDFFEAVLPEARKRKLACFAWMEESSGAPLPRYIANWPKLLEVDVLGRKSSSACMRNPDYYNWWFSVVEDYLKSYDLDGVVWCSEKGGPLTRILNGPVGAGGIVCFCEHCQAEAQKRGIHVERAKAGFKALLEWNQKAGKGERPVDGFFVTLWRILLEYPEVLAWDKMWSDGQHDILRGMWGTVKALDRNKRLGYHVCHMISWSPWYRATENFYEMADYCDFLKVVMYNNCAGPRYYAYHQSIHKSWLADAKPEETFSLMMRILNLEEGPLEELPQKGFSPDYVRRETERAVTAVAGKCAIYPGIDVDIPTGEGQSKGSREGVKEAVKAAFAGGAQGVILSRKYSEMWLDHLAGAGDALRELEAGG